MMGANVKPAAMQQLRVPKHAVLCWSVKPCSVETLLRALHQLDDVWIVDTA